MRPVIAEYGGMACGLCDEPIEEGDLIVKADDSWCHVECAERDGYEVDE